MTIITINDNRTTQEIQEIIDTSKPLDTLLFQGDFYLKEQLRFKSAGRQYIGGQNTWFYPASKGIKSGIGIEIGKNGSSTFGGMIQVEPLRDAMPGLAQVIYDRCRFKWMRSAFLWLFREKAWTHGCTIYGFVFVGNHRTPDSTPTAEH